MTPNEALSAIPVFRRLVPEHRALLEAAAARVSVAEGEIVVRAGQMSQAVYVVLAGALEAESAASPGAEPPSRRALARGDYFGETAVLEPLPSPVTIVATRPSRLLALTQVQLLAIMRREPEVAIDIARSASRLTRWAPEPPEAHELRLMREQMLVYARDLKAVYDDERARARQLSEAMLDTIRVLVNAIESRDPRQVGHGGRVARYAQTLARELGWNEERTVQAAIGGLIHDIGQISLADQLIHQRGPLGREDSARLRQHPELGARLLRGITSLEPILPCVLHHHESFDGTGYPDRLRGTDIPIEARLVAVADAFDEIRGEHPPGDAGNEAAMRALRRLAVDRLDPDLVAAFVAAWRAGTLPV